jgi:hypothetical protein
MPKSRIDYLIKDSFCAIALEELNHETSTPLWLEKHADLFASVTIKPEGLPRITDSNFEGETYENIQDFATVYASISSRHR